LFFLLFDECCYNNTKASLCLPSRDSQTQWNVHSTHRLTTYRLTTYRLTTYRLTTYRLTTHRSTTHICPNFFFCIKTLRIRVQCQLIVLQLIDYSELKKTSLAKSFPNQISLSSPNNLWVLKTEFNVHSPNHLLTYRLLTTDKICIVRNTFKIRVRTETYLLIVETESLFVSSNYNYKGCWHLNSNQLQ
jgi:hypothetical protein